MIVGNLNCRVEEKEAVVSAVVEGGTGPFELQYTVHEGALANRADPFIAAALLPAMRLGQPLQVAGAVSPQLLNALPTIQQVFHCWDSHLHPVPVQIEAENIPQYAGDRGVACFFSGGIDSYYTALKHLDEIDACVFVHGFDIAIEDREIREEVSRSLAEASAELGKPLLQVKTNIRAFLREHVSWDMAHGAAAASVALVLAPLFRRVYIASSFTFAELIPWGSHPLVDPLWSTEDLSLVHDGCEATRADKTSRIARIQSALSHLRVCQNNRGGVMNCGRCGKCLRAMIALQLAGALERSTVFSQTLEPNAVAQMDLTEESVRKIAESLLKELEVRGSYPDIAEALSVALERVQPRIINRQEREIARLAKVLESTQAWARELQAAAVAGDRDLERLRAIPLLARLARFASTRR